MNKYVGKWPKVLKIIYKKASKYKINISYLDS